MDVESAKPRINGSMLSSSMGKYVCVVGKNMGVSLNFTVGFALHYLWIGSMLLFLHVVSDFSRWIVRVCRDE
jgi:hypothetical protein